MKKNWFALLLALCLALSAFGAAAEAMDIVPAEPEIEVEVDEAPEQALEIGDDFILSEAEGGEEVEEQADPVGIAMADGDDADPAEGEKVATVTYIGSELWKVYDKTRNVISADGTWLLDTKLTTAMFSISGYVEGEEEVKITKVTIGKFESPEVGAYRLSLNFTLSGDYTCEGITIPARIDPRPVVVTPTKGLYKVYGDEDPANLGLKCTVKGLLQLTAAEQEAGKKLYTGAMTRESGEDAGRYLFQLGTLDFDNPNYEVSIAKVHFTIKRKSVRASDMGLVKLGQQQYTGKLIKPEITLRHGNTTLVKGVDFKVTYKNNRKPGKATVTISGIGNYTGTRKTTFKIVKIVEVEPTEVTLLKAGSKRFTVKWAKVKGVTGYQVQYGLKKSFSGAKKVTVKGASKVKKLVTGLKSGKTYYIRVRAYKKSGGKAYYSSWSETVRVKPL